MAINMKSVAKKLNDSSALLKAHGRRNETSTLLTFNRIYTSINNLRARGLDMYDPTASISRGFSSVASDFSENPGGYGDFAEGPGLNSVAGAGGIDVVDISVIAAARSFMPILAIERSMSKETDIITIQELVAVNANGDIEAGEVVASPFRPYNANVNLARTASAASQEATGAAVAAIESLTFGFPIAKTSVVVAYTVSGGSAVTGTDVKGDGKVLFDGAGISMTIDYAEGTVATAGILATGDVISVSVTPDTSSEMTGSHTLTVRPRNKNLTATAVSNRIILQTSLEQDAFMNKVLTDVVSAGGKFDYTRNAIQQLMNVYIYWLNNDLVKSTWKAAVSAVETPQIFDVSTYYSSGNFSQFSTTKDDKIRNFMLSLEQDVLTRSNRGITYWLTSAQGARILAGTANFRKTKLYSQTLDGVIGYYDDVPVLRHQAMNMLESAGSNINIVGGHRDISGSCAPVGYFEFLPIFSTKPAINFQNPTEMSQALFNMSVSAPIVETLITRGQFKLI